ncbi:hypothetical protein KC460_04440 [Candidatus Dependentiae bacterium]|nr:hypothetical protein [Candidatus Dependentiae bacterium]
MKKYQKWLLSTLLFLAVVPALVNAWCCMPPDKHCENSYTFDENGKDIFVDEKGNNAAKDSDNKCAKCHHDIEAHMCDESGWPE